MLDRYAVGLGLSLLLAAAGYNWRLFRCTAGPAGRRPEGTVAVALPARDERASAPLVTVLSAAWNEADMVEGHIRSFKRLGYPAKQLVIGAGGEDDTYGLAAALADDEVTVLRQYPGEGKQGCLERCLEASTGQTIVLADADCILDDEAFGRLVGPILGGEADAVTGYRRPYAMERGASFVNFQWLVESASLDPRHQRGLWGGNAAVRREPLERSGALRAVAPTGTDYVQGRRLIGAGYRIGWIPGSVLETRYPRDPATYLHTWRRWIKNILIHGPRFGDWRAVAESLVAVALATSTLVTTLAAPVFGRWAVVLPLTALGVATMNRLRRIGIGARLTGSRAAWRTLALAPLFALLDQVAPVLAALDSLSRDRRSRW